MNPPTPLMAAAKASVSCELVRLLLSRGADFERRDRAGRTASDFAREAVVGERYDRHVVSEPLDPDEWYYIAEGQARLAGEGERTLALLRDVRRRVPEARPEARALVLLASLAAPRAAAGPARGSSPRAPRGPPQTEDRGGAGDRGAGSDERLQSDAAPDTQGRARRRASRPPRRAVLEVPLFLEVVARPLSSVSVSYVHSTGALRLVVVRRRVRHEPVDARAPVELVHVHRRDEGLGQLVALAPFDDEAEPVRMSAAP